MKHRSRTDIVALVLATVKNHDGYGYGVTQTTIRNEVFLSGAQLKEHLIALTIHGLLSYNSTARTHNATEKGLRFLNIYYKMDDMVNKGEQQQLSSLIPQQVQM